jgi:hypothetical protein
VVCCSHCGGQKKNQLVLSTLSLSTLKTFYASTNWAVKRENFLSVYFEQKILNPCNGASTFNTGNIEQKVNSYRISFKKAKPGFVK